MRTGIVVLGAVLLAGQAVAAEPPGGVLAAKTMRCKVDKGAVSEPEKWGEVSTVRWGKKNVLHFDAIDIKKGKARIIGGAGGADVLVIPGRGGLHFIERTPSGNMVLRTVFAGAVGPRRYRYVTSRHVNLPGGPLPSQYYGTCKVLDWR
jgi:hypothetical protein